MTKMRRFVVIDTETGGLDPNEHSILSLGAVYLLDGAIQDTFSVVIAEPEMSTTLEALRVNGMTMAQIEAEGLPPVVAVNALTSWLLKNDLRQRNTLAGHNVAFDIGFLKRLYRQAGKTDKEYSNCFSHRSLCTQTLALGLDAACVREFPHTSLDGLAKALGVVIREGGEKGKHDSLEDAVATAKILVKELALMRLSATLTREPDVTPDEPAAS